MSITLNGDFAVAQTPDEVYQFLTDPERFAPLLPGYKSHQRIDDRSFKVSVEVGVPQVKGLIDANVQLVEANMGSGARFRSSARHALGIVDSELHFRLSALVTGTQVNWESGSTVRGSLASIANGILVPLAKRNVAAMIRAMQNALGPIAVESAASAPRPSRKSWWRRLLASFGFSAPKGS
jgi:carbon monoxide dehydrogenase subunit G